MVSRTFTVYVDEPSTIPVPVKQKSSSKSTSRSTTPFSPSNSRAALPLPDKENSHPVTGERASSIGSSDKKTLKRKTGVLETKLYVPPKSKKSKDSAELVDSLKSKRRGLSAPPSSTAPATPPASPRKAKKASSSTGTAAAKARRNSARKAAGKAPVVELPRVDEEPEVQQVEGDAAQIVINAKCYELTVSPLADVSEAYEADPEAEPAARPTKKTKKPPVPTVETEIRDYLDESHVVAPQRKLSRSVSLPVNAFCAALSSTSNFPSFTSSSSAFDFSDSLSTIASSSSSQSTLVSVESSPLRVVKEVEDVLAQPALFDTPERKRIYSAFTFSTPSPSSERFRRARSTSVDCFGDIKFVPVA